MHTFSGCILYVCTFFYAPASQHKMYTQGSPATCCLQKVYTLPGHRLRPGRLAIPAAGLRFSRHKVHTLGRPVSRHKVHIFTAPPFPPSFLYFFSYFLKSAYTSRTPQAAGREKEKVHTLAGHHKDNRSGQKVHTLGSPVLFAKSMHTRQPQIVKKCIH